jgi:hypothetical protein
MQFAAPPPMTTLLIVIILAVAGYLALVVLDRPARAASRDSVAEFNRALDALNPRRPRGRARRPDPRARRRDAA